MSLIDGNNINDRGKSIALNLEALNSEYKTLLISYQQATINYVNYLQQSNNNCDSSNNTADQNCWSIVKNQAFWGVSGISQSRVISPKACATLCAQTAECSGATFNPDNNICILKLYGHNNRCIVNTFSERKKVFFGTFQLVFLYLLIDYQYAICNRNDREKNNYMSMITRLLKARELYLDTHNITILDKSPFQEFTLQCLGSTEDPMRMARLEGLKKREAGKQVSFNYKPKGNPGKVPVYRFDNTSGNEILNK